MRDEVVQRLTLETALLEAIEDEQFELHYQPLVDLVDGTVIGYEALIRWRHPEWGLVSPNHFLPVVEESDMIVAVGDWAMRRALSDLPALQRAAPRCQRVAVNVSAGQLAVVGADQLLTNALAMTGRDACELTLEITESAILHSSEATVDGLERAAALGASIAIDDFGTGYSSLAQVQDLPGDVLKIDRRFVSPLTESQRARDLFASVVSMGHSLGMKVVAEGIEGPRQLEIVRASACDRAQGFWFAPPLPLGQLGTASGTEGRRSLPA
jgi:EAL domain-containing protein (putative c-di-GMP-specific phosphodiesterase class I)